jgi:hypothetical protein
MNEFQTLNIEIGGIKIKDMSAMTFLQWMANKLNGVKARSSDTVELTALISSPPMSRTMPEADKIKIIRKLIKLGVEIK